MMTDGVGAVWVCDALCGTSAPGRCPSLWLKCPFGAVGAPSYARRTPSPPAPHLGKDEGCTSALRISFPCAYQVGPPVR